MDLKKGTIKLKFKTPMSTEQSSPNNENTDKAD